MVTSAQLRWKLRYLRPAKLRNAVERRAFERVVRSLPVHPDGPPCEHLGTDYAGWPVPLDLVGPDGIVYGVGAGNDVSWDLELIRRCGCSVWTFDPTDASRENVEPLTRSEPRLHFMQVAIWRSDGTVPMNIAENPAEPAVSAANLHGTGRSHVMPVRSIPSLMAEYGHDHIDVLKYDVEGAEYDLWDSVDLEAWGVRVFLIEVHKTGGAAGARRIHRDLESRGYRLICRKNPTNLVFLRG